MMQIKKAIRTALPLQIAFVGPTNSGKTLSALLFAAGLKKPGDRVVVIDTEKGRASMYADNKRVLSVMPEGFDVIELDAPYHPKRFIEAVDTVEKAGYKICLIDSASDEWDGLGGCTDIAEKDGGRWNNAKLWNKRFMSRIVLSDMHVICCLKAQEKTKIIDKTKTESGKQEYVELGMQPIWEKNNFYPITLAFMVDPKTHLARAIKVHDDFAPLFEKDRLITKDDGERIRQWNETGVAQGPNEQLSKRARAAAQHGSSEYRAFWEELSPAQRTSLVHEHEKNKTIAANVTAEELRLAQEESGKVPA